MTSRRAVGMVVLLSAMVTALAQPSAGLASSPAAALPPRFAPGQALVGIEANQRSIAAQAIRARGGGIISYYAPGAFFVVETPGEVLPWLATIRGEPGVRFAEPDFLVTTDDVIPNDPGFGSQWGLQTIGAPSAWDTSTGSPSVVVGVIDSGVEYTHEDLASRMWTNPGEIAGNGIDDEGNGYIDDVYGADCRNNDGDPIDDFYHGTHVSGIIGAAGDNGVGIAGVAWNVRIMALKFIGAAGSGRVSDAVKCVDYAVQQGASVTNNSWGVSEYSQALFDAIVRARAAGQLFVASAGNAAKNTDSVSSAYPSSYDLDNVVSVASSDSADALSTTSNYGPMTVDLAAPGVDVLSTYPGNRYETLSGTSMAAPHVTGAAALLLSAYPSLSYRQLEDRLLGSVARTAGLAGKLATGGRLDVARAIEADSTAPGTPALLISGATATSLSTSWTAAGDDGSGGGAASSYELRYRLSGTDGWAQAPAPVPAVPGTEQSATISGLRPGTRYDLSLVVRDNVGNISTATSTGSTTFGAEIFAEDTEGGGLGWSKDSPWAISAEHVASPTHSWTDSPGQPYAPSLDISLRSPSFSLEGAVEPKLSFWHRHNLQQDIDFGTVLVSTDGGASWTELARYTGGRELSPVVLDLSPYAGSPDVRLRFRLQTNASVSFDGWYVDDVVVTARDTTAPGAPQGPIATAGDGVVTLDWADNTEPDLSGYVVYRTTDPPEVSPRTWTSVATPTSSEFTDGGVTNGTTYFYRITAIDTAANESPSSGEVSAVPADTTAPEAPQGLSATAGDGVVTLDWADNTEPDLSGYVVYRTTDPPEVSPRTWTSVATPTSSEFTDGGVTNGTTYFYRITAIDTAANESPSSGEVSAVPARPTKSFPATRVVLSKGTSLGDPIGSLADADDTYFRIRSAKVGANYFADWYGSTIIDAGPVTRLTVSYEGSWTGSVAQTVFILNFSAGQWEEISSANVSGTDFTLTWSTTTASPYISAQREIRVRVLGKSRTQVTCRADLMRFTVQY